MFRKRIGNTSSARKNKVRFSKERLETEVLPKASPRLPSTSVLLQNLWSSSADFLMRFHGIFRVISLTSLEIVAFLEILTFL